MNERKFYDLNVVFESDREAIIKRAEELELSGICFVHTYKNEAEFEGYLQAIETLRKTTAIDLISGVKLTGEDMETLARKIRRKVEVILAHGGNYNLNRIACSSDYIDILCHPELGRRDCGLDHICCKLAKEHTTTIELNFKEVLISEGIKRVKKLYLLKEIVRLCMKTSAPFIVNSAASNPWQLRGGRELSALSCTLGAGLYPSLVSNSELPEKMVSENRKKIDMPLKGVKVNYAG